MPALNGPDILIRPPSRVIGGGGNTYPTPRKPNIRSRIDQKIESTKEYLIFAKDELIDIITEIRVLRIPLLNWGIICIYGAWLIRLTLRFTKLYSQHALLTMMVTNLLLYGLADTLAQTLRSMIAFKPESRPERSTVFVKYILEKGRPRRVILDEEDDDLLELGLDPDLLLEDLDDHQTSLRPGLPVSQPEIFHFRRLALFSIWGLIISFFQSPWYAFLNGSYNEDNKFLQALKRVLTDQLCFSPISLACFLSYMTVVLEGGDKAAVATKLKTVYLPTLGLNYLLWPTTQFFNFMVMPKHLQIPLSSTVGVFWNAYLSLKNAR